jgi:hypothetical protein
VAAAVSGLDWERDQAAHAGIGFCKARALSEDLFWFMVGGERAVHGLDKVKHSRRRPSRGVGIGAARDDLISSNALERTLVINELMVD